MNTDLLIRGIKTKNTKLINLALKLGANVKVGLKYACSYGHLQMVERMIELLNLNGGLNHDDVNWGFSLACQYGHLQIVERMIELGANSFNWGLERACQGGHLQIVKRMIELGANNFNRGLTSACIGGHLQIVEIMTELGANNFNQGLMHACYNGHMNIVDFFVKKGIILDVDNECKNKYNEWLKKKTITFLTLTNKNIKTKKKFLKKSKHISTLPDDIAKKITDYLFGRKRSRKKMKRA